jgi:hypothetical protein
MGPEPVWWMWKLLLPAGNRKPCCTVGHLAPFWHTEVWRSRCGWCRGVWQGRCWAWTCGPSIGRLVTGCTSLFAETGIPPLAVSCTLDVQRWTQPTPSHHSSVTSILILSYLLRCFPYVFSTIVVCISYFCTWPVYSVVLLCGVKLIRVLQNISQNLSWNCTTRHRPYLVVWTSLTVVT